MGSTPAQLLPQHSPGFSAEAAQMKATGRFNLSLKPLEVNRFYAILQPRYHIYLSLRFFISIFMHRKKQEEQEVLTSASRVPKRFLL